MHIIIRIPRPTPRDAAWPIFLFSYGDVPIRGGFVRADRKARVRRTVRRSVERRRAPAG